MQKTSKCPLCGDKICSFERDTKTFCKKCSVEVAIRADILCPECSDVLERMWIIDADESMSGKTEHLYNCDNCGSAWQITEGEPIQRYFFG